MLLLMKLKQTECKDGNYLQCLVSFVCGSHATRAASTCSADESAGLKKLIKKKELMQKIIGLNNNYVAAEMLQHDWVLQTYQTQVGQGRTRGSNAGTTEQHPPNETQSIRQTWALRCSVARTSFNDFLGIKAQSHCGGVQAFQSEDEDGLKKTHLMLSACRPAFLLSGPLHTVTHASIRLPEDP